MASVRLKTNEAAAVIDTVSWNAVMKLLNKRSFFFFLSLNPLWSRGNTGRDFFSPPLDN